MIRYSHNTNNKQTLNVKFVNETYKFFDTNETLVKKVDASKLTFMSEDGSIRTIARVYYSINTSKIENQRRTYEV